MFFQKSSIQPVWQTRADKTPGSRQCQLPYVSLAFFCLLALTSGSGCVTSGGAAASNNAQGVEYFSAGEYDKAIAYFNDSLASNPDSAETYYNLGSAYQRKANKTGDLSLLTQAEEAYWTALQLDPAPETIVCCYRGIATSATSRGDSESAMRTLEEWRDRNPDSIEPKLEIAYLLEAEERDDEAYEALQEIVELAPNDYRAYYKMGILSERAGDLDDAVEQTNVATQLNPSDVRIAQRARTLQSQYAAKQRELEEDATEETADTQEALADGTVESQTTRVQSTSAQGETTPDLVFPPEESPATENTSPTVVPTPQTTTEGTSKSAYVEPSLGFGEIVAYSQGNSPDMSASHSSVAQTRQGSQVRFAGVQTSEDNEKDSDVKWITAATSNIDRKISQTSASIAQKAQGARANVSRQITQVNQKVSTTAQRASNQASDAIDKVAQVNQTLKEAAQSTTNQIDTTVHNISDVAQTTVNDVKTTVNNVKTNVETALDTQSSRPRARKPTTQDDSAQKSKARTEMGAGLPRMRAGSFF